METLQKRQKILDVLSEIEKELQEHPDTIPDHVFQVLEAFCKVVYVWKYSDQKKGWSRKLGYFTPPESEIIESRFHDFDEQIGGGAEEDKAFAEQYKQFEKILGQVGTQWREIVNALGVITTNTLGSAAEKVKAILPKEMADKPFPTVEEIRSDLKSQKEVSTAILMFFSAIVETLRIWVAYSFIDSTTYRVLLSFSQSILDTLRGQIRQAFFSSLGLFGQHGYYISVFTRFLLNIIETISPQLPAQIEMDMYKNVKTLTAAGLLWGYYTFAPLTLKYNINMIFDEIKKLAKDDTINVGSLKDKIKTIAKNENLVLPNIPLENVPTYEDLQSLSTLLRNPEIACMSSFKKLIVPLRSIFTLRLTLDLLNIPTGLAELDDLCSTNQASKTRKQKGGKPSTILGKRKTRRIISS